MNNHVISSMLSSIIDQQSHYFELFEKEQHLRERERQTQMEHDQAMLCMFAQVIGASTHTAPGRTRFSAPIYATEQSSTLHTLSRDHQSSPGFPVCNQEVLLKCHSHQFYMRSTNSTERCLVHWIAVVHAVHVSF